MSLEVVPDLPPAGPLADEIVLVTGDIPGLSRDAAKRAVVALGGKSVSAPSGKVTLVVAGVGAGVSKMDKVRINGSAIVTEVHFTALLADQSAWEGTDPRMTHPEWVAHLEALNGEADSEEPRFPRPGDPDYVPLAERHLVGIGSDSTRIGRVFLSRLRCGCQCGHKWVVPMKGGAMPLCPVGTGEIAEPIRLAPWTLPGGGWELPEEAEAALDDEPDDAALDESEQEPPLAQVVPFPTPADVLSEEAVSEGLTDATEGLTEGPESPTEPVTEPVRGEAPTPVLDPASATHVPRFTEPAEPAFPDDPDEYRAEAADDWAFDAPASQSFAIEEPVATVTPLRQPTIYSDGEADELLTTCGHAYQFEIVDDLAAAPRY